MTLAKAREELERYLPAARQQAADRLRGMIKEGAPSAAIANARTELAYVRHAKGPVDQTHLLTYLGVRQVDAIVGPQQTPLERVREIGAALGVQINAQQPTHVQRAVRALERPVLPPGHSPGQERLAEQFIKNTPEKNHADPRLGSAQAIVDAAMQTARDPGDNSRMIGTIGESTRHLVADRIKTGDALDGELGHAALSPRPRDEDRTR